MEVFGDKKTSKNITKFSCILCDFVCSKKGDWDRHLSTLKHVKVTQGDALVTQKTSQHKCQNCNKHYSSRNGLWKHKQKCYLNNDRIKTENNNEDTDYLYQGINIKDKDALMLHLLKQNEELHHKIIEMGSQVNSNNSNSFNTTNNAFKLNFFLNETCKNAMNITDFISSIQLNLDDLEHTGMHGYIDGVSNIIIKNLNKLETHMRPLHCSDVKREVLYIKDNNQWTKETESKPVLTNAIKIIANENIKQINKWKNSYPDCIKSDSKKND